MGEERKMYKVFMGNPKGKRPIGLPRCRWENGIRMALRKIGCGGVWSGFSWLTIGAGGRLL
jgi:hypothetical protein